jgi:hypothetical protein
MGLPLRRVVIPYRPRKWARAFHQAPSRWAALVLHRRAGKTTAVLNHHQRAAMSNGWERKRLLGLAPELSAAPDKLEELIHPPGGRNYGHCLPTLKQAKLVAWEPLKFYARAIPGIKINESELSIKYPTGHRVRLFGADDPDSLRGPAFSGFSFDEYGQQNPVIFTEIISKALGDHLGYAIFCGTIKGKDHLFQTYEAAKVNPATWFALWQTRQVSLAQEDDATIDMLRRAIADDEELVKQGVMSQDEFDQEWDLSTDAAIKGAYYTKEMGAAKKDGRIRAVPYDATLPVVTAWDLGIDDYMAIWFAQILRSGEIRLIDYLQGEGEGLPYYAAQLQSRGYVYAKHYAPHDIMVRELGTGKSRFEVAASLGIKFEVAPDVSLADGIHAVRLLIARCWFDETRCALGLNALRQYKKRYNAALQAFGDQPVHDAFSHGADAFRTLATCQKGAILERRKALRSSGHSGAERGAWMRG